MDQQQNCPYLSNWTAAGPRVVARQAGRHSKGAAPIYGNCAFDLVWTVTGCLRREGWGCCPGDGKIFGDTESRTDL